MAYKKQKTKSTKIVLNKQKQEQKVVVNINTDNKKKKKTKSKTSGSLRNGMPQVTKSQEQLMRISSLSQPWMIVNQIPASNNELLNEIKKIQNSVNPTQINIHIPQKSKEFVNDLNDKKEQIVKRADSIVSEIKQQNTLSNNQHSFMNMGRADDYGISLLGDDIKISSRTNTKFNDDKLTNMTIPSRTNTTPKMYSYIPDTEGINQSFNDIELNNVNFDDKSKQREVINKEKKFSGKDKKRYENPKDKRIFNKFTKNIKNPETL